MGLAADIQYEKDLERFFELASILEVPAVKPKALSLSRWHLDELPDVPGELKLAASGLEKPLEHYIQYARSYNRNAYNLSTFLHCFAAVTGTGSFGDTHLNVKDTAGNIRGSSAFGISGYSPFTYNSTYGNTARGILIGTDNTGESFQDYAPIAKIPHGDANGELRYWDMFPNQYTWSAGTRKWTITVIRYFTNHSGGDVTVRELCLVGLVKTYVSSYNVCYSRDVLGSTLTVGDHDLIQAKYTIESVAFPS